VELKAWDRLVNRIETSLRKIDEKEQEKYPTILASRLKERIRCFAAWRSLVCVV